MYSYSQVVNGLSKYIDNEIVNKITGLQRWIIGTGVGVALSKGVNVFNNLKENEIIKMLDIIDKDDNIDIDTIYANLKKEAQKGAVTFNAPVIGALTLNETDVDKLYEYIKQ